MKARIPIVLAALALAVGLLTSASAGPRASSHEPRQVRVLGDETFEANALIQATFRFSPERFFPHSGERVFWTEAAAVAEPHTITIVRRGQLPGSIQEVFNCPACNAALDAHFAQGEPPILRVNVGAPGLDQPGDSLWLEPGGSISAQVSAPAGSTLYYLCSIHGWMQGRLVVG